MPCVVLLFLLTSFPVLSLLLIFVLILRVNLRACSTGCCVFAVPMLLLFFASYLAYYITYITVNVFSSALCMQLHTVFAYAISSYTLLVTVF